MGIKLNANELWFLMLMNWDSYEMHITVLLKYVWWYGQLSKKNQIKTH